MQELPYRIEQRHLSWRVLKDGSIRIHHLLLVEKEGHRKILIGKNGDVIRLFLFFDPALSSGKVSLITSPSTILDLHCLSVSLPAILWSGIYTYFEAYIA